MLVYGGGGRNNEPSGTGVVLSSTGTSTSIVKRIPASIQLKLTTILLKKPEIRNVSGGQCCIVIVTLYYCRRNLFRLFRAPNLLESKHSLPGFFWLGNNELFSPTLLMAAQHNRAWGLGCFF